MNSTLISSQHDCLGRRQHLGPPHAANTLWSVLSVCVAAIALLVPLRFARANDRGPVVVDPRRAGSDYLYQGEYVDYVSRGYRRQPVGVQVVAQGDGTFQVVRLNGGLPGSGWDRQRRETAPGTRRGRFARAEDETSQALVLPREVWLYDSRGVRRGVLRKTFRRSPTLGAAPPAGAEVLFDGTSTEHFQKARMTDDGLLAEGAVTKRPVRDFFLHVEFRTPFMPGARGQARGNSGIYIQQRYEVQILDSFGLEGVENECGALYKTRRPDVNMCLPPLVWQTYDILFRAARFDAAGNKTENARITVRHNGVLIHNNVEIPNKTGAGRREGPEPRPIVFQNHHNPVRFRNIWIVHRGPSADRQPNRPSLQQLTQRRTPLPEYGQSIDFAAWSRREPKQNERDSRRFALLAAGAAAASTAAPGQQVR